MKYFQVNKWIPDEEGVFQYNQLRYRIILRKYAFGCFVHFPELNSNVDFFRVFNFRSGQDCLSKLCPNLSNMLGGDWPYLETMSKMLIFCEAIEQWLDNRISIY